MIDQYTLWAIILLGGQIMSRPTRLMRWVVIVATVGVLPSFILRCDKAALNFQRSLMEGLGEEVAEWLMTQIPLEEVE